MTNVFRYERHEKTNVQGEILRLLNQNGRQRTSELEKDIGVRRQSINQALRALERKGNITIIQVGRHNEAEIKKEADLPVL